MALLLSACDSTQDINSQVSSTTVPSQNYATVEGRVVSGTGGAGQYVPVSGVTVYAYAGGKKVSTTTDADGFWALTNIPVTAAGLMGSSNAGGVTLTVYFEKTGWAAWSESVTAAATDGTQSTAFQVDMGPRTMSPLTLRVTSNVIHDGTVFLGSGATDYNVLRDYLADPAANITLNFNMPVDTTYTGTSFVELVAPDGTLVPFAGSWSTDGMTFTINPTADLTADSNDLTRYRVRFVHLAKALNGTTAFTELDNVEIAFNVVLPTHGALLASQAPSIAPQLDQTVVGGIAGNFTAYEFDTAGFYRKRTIDGSSDYVDAGNSYTANNVVVSWPAVTGAVSYNLYYRNSKTNAGDWTIYGSYPSTAAGTNGLFVQNVNLSPTMGADSLLTGSESVQMLVTATNNDGIESSLAGVTPLTIADARNPTVAGASTSGRRDATPLSPASKVNIGVGFNEIMGTTATGQPALASLSGLVSAIDTTAATKSWTSTTGWQASGATMNFRVANTTLANAASSGDTNIKVASVGALMVNDQIMVGDASGFSGPHTINRIASADGRLYLNGGGLSQPFSASAAVRLVNSGNVPGLTYFEPTALSSGVKTGDTTLTVADGSRFFPKMNVTIYRQDENGYSAGATVNVLAVNTNTLTLSAPIASAYNAGSLVQWSGAPALAAGGLPVQPLPRSASNNAALAADIQFNTNAVNTTLAAAAQWSADFYSNYIDVADSTGLATGDWITIGASSATSTLGADVSNAATLIPVATTTGSQFLVGDVLRIPGETVETTTGAAVAAGATALPVSPALPVLAGETLTISEPMIVTYSTAAAAAGTSTLTLISTTGLATGQNVLLTDESQAIVTYTIASVNAAANQITLTAPLASAWGAGTAVTRLATSSTAVVQTSTAASPITVTLGLPALSATATVKVARASENVTVSAIAGDNLTVTRAAAPAFHRSGSQIALLSEPEVRQIGGFSSLGNRLPWLNAPLSFMHRQGAAVTKQPQGVMTLTAMPANGVAVGDTVVIDTLSSGNFANTRADRFDATVVAVDTANNQVTVTANTARARVDYSTADVWFMGDAAVVSGAVDSNGNAVRSTSDNRVNLSNGLTK